MSQADFELTASPRTDLGKGASRRLRRIEDCVPGIIYGAGKPATPITLLQKDLRKSLENEAFYSHILKVTVDGKTEKVVLKDLQRHPYKPVLQHVDFMRINPKQKLIMHVPLHFINQASAPGVKEGGIVTHHFVELEIKCLPADLPEFIEIDLGQMEMDSIIHLSQVKLPSGTELVAAIDEDHDVPVASLHRPRVVVESEDSAGETSSSSDAAKK